MSAFTRCGRCGASLAPAAVDGLCPACLLERGLDGPPERVGAGAGRASRLGCFGDYELLEEIARGGMGIVYKARQISLDRIVALKMILTGPLAGPAEVKRFLVEARTAATLQHPSIVAIHEVGELDGQHFFSMDYIEGRSLAQLVNENALPPGRAARYVKAIAEAVHYAHQRGVLHRDLKPSNVLVDTADQPRVTDFGLAKRLDNAEPGAPSADLTLAGQILGSPNFMPPEQAGGHRQDTGPASDVYGLGAILYHLITGRAPFLADSFAATLRLVAESEPALPRVLAPAVPRDLETICLKCLDKDPARRYESARELAEELGRFLHDQPIQARPAGLAEKCWRWCRRHTAVASLTLVVSLLILTVAIVSTVAALRLERANRAGQEKLREAYFAQARANRLSARPGRRFASLDALRKAAAIWPSAELRTEAIACLGLLDLRSVKEWETPAMAPFVFDANHERYATTNDQRTIVVRRVADDREVRAVAGAPTAVQALELSPDGQFLAVRFVGGQPGSRVYDLRTNAMPIELSDSRAGAFGFSADNRFVAVAQRAPDSKRAVVIYELSAGRPVHSFVPDFTPAIMKFNPKGDQLALVESRGTQVQIRQVASGALVRSLDHPKPVSGLDWHPQGDGLAVSSYDSRIHVWDLSQREPRRLELAHGDVATFAVYGGRGGLLASVGWNNLLRLWNATSGRELLAVPALGYRGVSFSPDDRRIAYWPGERRIRLCELAAGYERRTIRLDRAPGNGRFINFSVDGQLPALMVGRHLRLWEDASSRELARVPEEGLAVALYERSGKNLLTAGANGLKRWPLEVRGEAELRTLRIGPAEVFGPPGPVEAVWRLRDGDQVLVLRERVLHILDGATRRELSRVQLDAKPDCSVPSPDGTYFVSWTPDAGVVRVWDVASGRVVATLPGPERVGLDFTWDSRLLVIGSQDGYAAWHCGSWKPAWSMRRPDNGGMRARVAFSLDGRLGAATHGPESIRLFDPTTGREFADLEAAEAGAIVALKFSPDGGRLMVNTDGSEIHVWDLRLIREQLAAMRLDWDSPPLPPLPAQGSPGPPQITVFQVAVPARDPRCRPAQIDLATHYNCAFSNFVVMSGMPGNDLRSVPTGLQTFAGTAFDVRGVVQLLGKEGKTRPAPAEVTAIRVDRSCRVLNLLHSCISAGRAGTVVGDYAVHYADGRSAIIPLKTMGNIADWWQPPSSDQLLEAGTVVAWRGRNPASQQAANDIVLYKLRWVNPHPETPIASLEFKSSLSGAAPFLVAITTE